MSCCLRITKAFTGSAPVASETKTKEATDVRAIETDYNEGAALDMLKSRPERTGKWFIAHKSVAQEIMNEIDLVHEPIEIWDEFFSVHPVGVEYCKNFVALSLSESDIEKYHEKIRLASYRWEDIKGMGSDGSEYHAPSNYVWFLEWLEKEKVLGWMDFMANIVVNVPGGETVAYMGSLYAYFRTVSHWMVDPLRLEAALERGWIFQETAFGAFDCSAITKLLGDMRDTALSSLSSKRSHSKESRIQNCLKFVKNAEHVSKLLDRRGYYALAQNSPFLCDRQYDYYSYIDAYALTENVSRLVVSRVLGDNEDWEFQSKVNHHVCKGYDKGYTAMFHLCDLFTDTNDENFNKAYKIMYMLLTERSWKQASSVDELFIKIGDPLWAAFSCLEVTYETDRDNASTQVAKAVLESDYGKTMDHKTFCRSVWAGAADVCLQTQGMIGTTVIKFQPTGAEGNRFIGGLSVSGARLRGDGSYKLSTGSYHQCNWALTCVSSYSMAFQWDEGRSSWALNKDDEDDGRRYDIFLCKPPEGINFFSGYVARLVEGGPPTHAQFFTDQTPPGFPEPAQEAVFC